MKGFSLTLPVYSLNCQLFAMLTNLKLIAIIAYIMALAVSVNGQSSSTTSAAPPASTPPCVTACINSALSPQGCVSATDLKCVCTNPVFDQAAISCIQANCTTDERSQPIQLQREECAVFNGTSSATATSAAATPTTSRSSAMMEKVEFAYGGLIGATCLLVACWLL